jgi:hypothetical protein
VFSQPTVSATSVLFYQFDLMLRGALFDFMEHTHHLISPVAINQRATARWHFACSWLRISSPPYSGSPASSSGVAADPISPAFSCSEGSQTIGFSANGVRGLATAWLLSVMGSPGEEIVKSFDWHRDRITNDTPITASYRSTQNVRRYFRSRWGADFQFDRPFMAWLKKAADKTIGDAVDEWLKRKRGRP